MHILFEYIIWVVVLNIFWFSPLLGEDEPILTNIFFKWVETIPCHGGRCLYSTQAKPRITPLSAWSLTAWPRRFLRFFFGGVFSKSGNGFPRVNSQLRRHEVFFFQIYVSFLNILYVSIFLYFVFVRDLLFFNVIYVCCNYFHVTLFWFFGPSINQTLFWFCPATAIPFHLALLMRQPMSVGSRVGWVAVDEKLETDLWLFPKIGGFPPKSSILIGFSIIKPSILGIFPLFFETPI